MKLLPIIPKQALKRPEIAAQHARRMSATNRISEDGEFYPRIVKSAKEPTCSPGEMIIWYDTST